LACSQLLLCYFNVLVLFSRRWLNTHVCINLCYWKANWKENTSIDFPINSRIRCMKEQITRDLGLNGIKPTEETLWLIRSKKKRG